LNATRPRFRLARERELTGINMGCLLPCPDANAPPSIRKEVPMRIPALMIFAIGMAWAGSPARAQTYDPHYPVCMHVVGDGAAYYDCRFTTLAQCAASASGRSAECDANPFYAGAGGRNAFARSDRRYRPAY
jgi:hypothetical protein